MQRLCRGFVLTLLLSLITCAVTSLSPQTALASGPPLPLRWAVDPEPVASGTIEDSNDVSWHSTAVTPGEWYAFVASGSWRNDCPYGPYTNLTLNLTPSGSGYSATLGHVGGYGLRPDDLGTEAWTASSWIAYEDLFAPPGGPDGPGPTREPRGRLFFATPAGSDRLYFRIPDVQPEDVGAGENNCWEQGVADQDNFMNWRLYRLVWDTQPPETTHALTGTPGNDGWYTSPVTVTLTATDPDHAPEPTTGVGMSSLDDAPYTGPLTVNEEGRSTHTYYSTDIEGNVEAPHHLELLIDTIPPVSSVELPPDEALTSGTVMLSGTSLDATSGVAQVLVSLDEGASWQTASGTASWSIEVDTRSLTGGEHAVLVEALDLAGNREQAAGDSTIVIDNSEPTSVIDTPADQSYVAGTVAVGGTAADAGPAGLSRVELSLDEGLSWVMAEGADSWHFDWNTITYPDGERRVQSRALDHGGNVQEPPAAITVRIDNTPPVTRFATPGQGALVAGTVVFSGTASDEAGVGLDSVALSFDGGATWETAGGEDNWSAAWDSTAFEDAAYRVLARATDRLGNVETPPAELDIQIDNTPPDVAILAPLSGEELSGTVTLRGTAGDPDGVGLDVVEVSFDGGESWLRATGTEEWTLGWDTTAVPDGPYTVLARATDRLDNRTRPAHTNVLVDNTPPLVSWLSPLQDTFVGGLVPLSGMADDGVAGSGIHKVEISTDGGQSWREVEGGANWTGAWDTMTGLADGPYTLTARATDDVGNVGQGQVTIQLDNTPPTIQIDLPQAGDVVAGDVPVSGTADDGEMGSGLDIVECSFDGGASFTTVDGRSRWGIVWHSETYPDGETVIPCRATDRLGNPAGTSVSVQLANREPEASSVQLRLSKTGAPARARLEEEVVWTLRVDNAGESASAPATIHDPVPDTLDIVSATTSSGTFHVDEAAHEVVFEVGPLGPGEHATLTVTTLANRHAQLGEVCNAAYAENYPTRRTAACVELYPAELPHTGGGPPPALASLPSFFRRSIALVVAAGILSSGLLMYRHRARLPGDRERRSASPDDSRR